MSTRVMNINVGSKSLVQKARCNHKRRSIRGKQLHNLGEPVQREKLLS